MVGMFSRFYESRSGGLRRSQSAVDEREVLPPSVEATSAEPIATAVSIAKDNIEIAFEFKPVVHPMEPLDLDRPIQCPLPEPSMLNDGNHGRIWKEQVIKPDVPVVHMAASTHSQKPRPVPTKAIAPSISAPEGSILRLLEECDASTCYVDRS
ncbi:hypothetical protein F511_10563 [Dorcoceras hygrometricum]|uniref:Uncharacterized protein n=1 Tax=Dorcoceras hygrometricum TaxID=472368 RepID=A0A2Z7CHR5_9LAMI|nr:hypothetical protein F511_10563 [Dorcoceras hygrometricum]